MTKYLFLINHNIAPPCERNCFSYFLSFMQSITKSCSFKVFNSSLTFIFFYQHFYFFSSSHHLIFLHFLPNAFHIKKQPMKHKWNSKSMFLPVSLKINNFLKKNSHFKQQKGERIKGWVYIPSIGALPEALYLTTTSCNCPHPHPQRRLGNIDSQLAVLELYPL